eukprot:TRINITY_DN6146_c0_g4_i3.p1 TRINITY_DN6146_c0_g4~~TRINITY_DN6146_c0_g4_i3.p1  ORF type:complete len:141 (-),score=48.63 TRINITY_DN6146_c0_g4_i3:14-436(-)
MCIRDSYKEMELEKNGYLRNSSKGSTEKEDVVEMTIAEIFEGKPDIEYKGIFPLLKELIDESEGTLEEKEQVNDYLNFLLQRAKGTYRTGAKYIRDFVRSHPSYAFDSAISEKINYDLLVHLEKINNQDPKQLYLHSSYT